jgi:hypothetical protein
MIKRFSKTRLKISLMISKNTEAELPGLRRGIPNDLFDYRCSRMVNRYIEKLNNCEISHGIC